MGIKFIPHIETLMRIPLEEHPFQHELLRARQLSAAHDEMKRMTQGVILPEFETLIQVLIEHSQPYDIKTHGHGVIFNFGKPNKPYTIAFYGYPEDNEFEIAISPNEKTTHNFRRAFELVMPTYIRQMFEEFFNAFLPEVEYTAEHKEFELHDISHSGPYQLRIEDEGATSVVATVDEFEDVLAMATSVAASFREKDLVITEEGGKVIC